MFRKILPLLFLIALLHPMQAQFYLGLQAGATLPQGWYADSRMSDNQWMLTQGHQRMYGAGRGFEAGLDLSFALPFHPALEITLQVGGMVSSVSRDIQDYYAIRWANRYQQCSQYEMHLPRTINVPILAGVRYAYPTSRTTDFYAEALCGLNKRYITDWSFYYSDVGWPYSQVFANTDVRHYQPATTFAFQLGAGFIIAKRVTLGASYSVLGQAPLQWQRETVARFDVYGKIVEHSQTTTTQYHSVCPTMLTIHLDYRFPLSSSHVQDW